MSTDGTPTRFRKKRLTAYSRRGQLYSWLRAHRENVAKVLASGEMTLAAICIECHRHGVANPDGSPPTRRAAQKAWRTVVQDLAAAGLKPTDKVERPVYPSRMAKWTPPAILEAIAAGNPAVTGGVPTGAGDVNAAHAKAEQGLMLRQVPPPPVPPPKPTTEQRISRFASPDDPPEIHEAYAALEDQFDKADWYLMTGKPRKRRSK
jgi:hypothetical protein